MYTKTVGVTISINLNLSLTYSLLLPDGNYILVNYKNNNLKDTNFETGTRTVLLSYIS